MSTPKVTGTRCEEFRQAPLLHGAANVNQLPESTLSAMASLLNIKVFVHDGLNYQQSTEFSSHAELNERLRARKAFVPMSLRFFNLLRIC